jgi:hypothetical protein
MRKHFNTLHRLMAASLRLFAVDFITRMLKNVITSHFVRRTHWQCRKNGKITAKDTQ